jgi:hypothetical protein
MPATSFVARLLSGPYAEIVASGYWARERWDARMRSLSDGVGWTNQGRGGLLANATIGGDRGGQPQLAHHGRARADREREVLSRY